MEMTDIYTAVNRHGASYLDTTVTALARPGRLAEQQARQAMPLGMVLTFAMVSIVLGIGFQRLVTTDYMWERYLDEQIFLIAVIVGMWLLYCALCHPLARWLGTAGQSYTASLSLLLSIMGALYLLCSFLALVVHVFQQGLEEAGLVSYRFFDEHVDLVTYWLMHLPAAAVLTTLGLRSLHGIQGGRLLVFTVLNFLMLAAFELFGFFFFAAAHVVGFA